MPRYSANLSLKALLASWLVVGAASAQELVDASFCRRIEADRCIGVIASGASMRMDELATTQDERGTDYRTIYLWASTNNRSQRLVTFLVARTGDCYSVDSQPSLRGATGREIKNDWLTSIRGWLANHSLAEVWQFLGGSSVDAGDVGVKLSTGEASQRYRTYDFKFVHCPGQLRFRVIDSNGEPIPPLDRNIVRTVTITP